MLTSAGDTDLLEQIVSILCWNKAELLSCAKTAAVDVPTTVFSSIESSLTSAEAAIETAQLIGTADVATTASPSVNVLDIKLRVKWLKAVSEFDRFDLMVRFVSDALLAEAVEILDAQGAVDVSKTRKRYCKIRSS